MSPHLLSLLLLLFSSLSITPSLSDPRTSQAALICGNRTASNATRQTVITNFLSAMDAVSPQISSSGYARTVNGTGNETVFAFGECMKDLSRGDCDLCFAQCKTQILKCLPFQKATRSGRNYFDGCYLRYDDYNFFEEATSPSDRTVCNVTDFDGNRTAFTENSASLVRNLSSQALKNDGFFVGSVGEGGNSTAYGLAQCWEFVNKSGCAECLADAVTKIGSCFPKKEGRVLNSGCFMMYSTVRFYNNSDSSAGGGGGNGGRNLAIILAVVFSVFAVALVLGSVFFFGRRRLNKRRREKKQLGALAKTVNKSNLNFKYETLERATNYFDSSNKLGQGGSGSVFKGILPDGRAVAVKRLFFNTRQWVDDFFNEINLISGVHHKNLVKLLGCSITGPESLLVYEFVPNNSLHYHLSDRRYSEKLSWEMRYNIIVGTAEGLAYLHEESRLRIIHRDIKLSNVLLDENFTGKIADFGLARLFPEDRTHLSTGIAGTLGYMAPEYLVRGQLTEKVDVYSFGVLLIELFCGKRSNQKSQDPLSILQMVWNYYNSNRLPEAVDPILSGQFRAEVATRVLQIGLLCTQASAELRPSMSVLAKMLTDGGPIPPPSQPPFLNSNAENPFGRSSSRQGSSSISSGNSMTVSLIEPR